MVILIHGRGHRPRVYGTAGCSSLIQVLDRVYGESIDTVGAITKQAEWAAHQMDSIFHFV